MNDFNIPIVLMCFLRFDKAIKIIDKIKNVKPKKIYLLSDGGRNENEQSVIVNGRLKLEKSIDWNCNIIKIYQNKNVGVYKQIALGAKKVFELEPYAIFLEDDNLPEITFFYYCKKMLLEYFNNDKILWICGTNYVENYGGCDDYYFTKSLLPCGWASWSHKFLKYYEFNLESTNDKNFKQHFFKKYTNKKLARQQYNSIMREKKHFDECGNYYSWDHHMTLSIRMNDLFGIVPKYNQIKNIGIDENSIHGGNSDKNIMVKRFCLIKSYQLENIQITNKKIMINSDLEKKLDKIILLPFRYRLKGYISKLYHLFFKKEKI